MARPAAAAAAKSRAEPTRNIQQKSSWNDHNERAVRSMDLLLPLLLPRSDRVLPQLIPQPEDPDCQRCTMHDDHTHQGISGNGRQVLEKVEGRHLGGGWSIEMSNHIIYILSRSYNTPEYYCAYCAPGFQSHYFSESRMHINSKF